MANKKNVEASQKNTEKKNKKSNELEQKKPTKKKKLRLHSHLRVNIPLFQSLMMILPSLAKHATAEDVDSSGDTADQVAANYVTEKDVNDDHTNADSSAVTRQEAQTSDSDVNPTLSASHAPHGSSSHLVPSHHLSTLSHPQVHYIPSVSMPAISAGSNGQPTHSNVPTAPALPVTFMPEVIKGTYGELHVDANGQYTFVLNPKSSQYILLNQHQQGTDHFLLHLSDGSSVIVQVPVTGKQDTPNISGDLTGVVTEDHNIDSQGLLHANGKIDVIDPDQNESSVTPEVISGKYGSLTIDAGGHWQYQVDNSVANVQALTGATSLHESFTIHTKDGTPQTIDMTIGGNDDNAVIIGVDAGTITEDLTTQVQGQLSVTDSDLGEDHFQASQITSNYGTLSITKDGSWTYDLDNSNTVVQALRLGDKLSETITVLSADGTAHDITVTIQGTNDAPVIGGSSTGSVTEESTLQASGQLTITDVDKNQAHFQVGDLTGTYGTLHLAANGDWTYDLDNTNPKVQALAQGKTATDTIIVHSADGTPHQITITVNGTNDSALIAGTTSGSVTEESKLHASGQLSISDLDSGQDHFQSTDITGAYGSLHIDTDGLWTYDLDNSNSNVQALGDGDKLSETLTVNAADGTPHDIRVWVYGSNDAPVVSAEVVLTNGTEDTSIQLSTTELLANTTDIDHNDLGQLSIANLVSNHGIVIDNKDGTFTFTPEKDYNGDVHFSYDVKDAHGGVTHTGASTTLSARADTAVITGQDTGAITEDHNVGHDSAQSIQIMGSLSVTDPDAGQDHFIATNPMVRHERVISDPFQGELHIDRNGNWDYRVANGNPTMQTLKEGETKDVIYEVRSADGTTHRINITVTGTNDAPVVSSAVTLPSGTEDTNVTLTTAQLLANASDVDHGETAQLSVHNLSADHGTIADNKDGTYTFTPDADYNGTVHFTYDVQDPQGATVATSASMNLAAVDDAAVITGTGGHLLEEDNLYYGYTIKTNGQFQVVDPDGPGQSKFPDGLHHHTGSLGGTLQLYSNGNYFYHIENSAVNHLAKGQEARETFTIHSVDGTSHQVEFVIEGTNDAPFVHGDVTLSSGTEDTAVTLHASDLLAQAGDYDDGETALLSVHNLSADHGTVTDNKDGTYTFKPDADYNGPVHFTYDVQDPQGATVAASASMALAAVADAAIIGGTDSGNVKEDVHVDNKFDISLSGHLTIQDPDGPSEELFQTISLAATPQGGTLQLYSNGNWFYDINNHAIDHLDEGQIVQDTMTVYSKDGTAHVLHFTIEGTNDIPDINAQSRYLAEDGKVLNGKMHAYDPDDHAQLTFTLGHPVDGLTMHKDGSYSFDPSNSAYQHISENVQRTIQVPVTVTDEHGAHTTQNLSFMITGSNDGAVIAGNDSGYVSEDLNVQHHELQTQGTLTSHDIDNVDNAFNDESLSTLKDGSQALGTLHMDLSGTWTYTVDNHAIQSMNSKDTKVETFVVHSVDGTSHEVAVTIHGTNDAPIISSTTTLASGTEDTNVVLHASDLLTNATDIDHNDAGKLSVTNLIADHGKITDNQDGTFTFTPEKDYNGDVHFSYDVKDAHGGVTHTGASTTLSAVDDVAVITGTGGHLLEEDNLYYGYTIKTNGQFQVVDPDGPGQSKFPDGLHHHTGTLGGTLQLYGNGNYFYHIDNSTVNHLAKGQEAKETFTIHSVDGTPHQVEFVIEGTNDAPFVHGDVTLSSGTEDTAITLHAFDLLAQAGDYDDGETAQLSVHNLSADHGTIIDNKDGTYTFNPDADYNGTVHFSYDIQDPQGATVATSASMVLAAVADAPVLNVDIADTADNVLNASESGAATISGSLDPNVASTLDCIEITDGTTTVTVDKADITVVADGSYQTTTDISSLKEGTLTVTAHATSHDGTTATSTDTIIKDSVASVHDNNASMNENQPSIHGNLIADDEAGVQVTGGLGEQLGSYGKFVIHANGSYTYTPDARAQALNLNDHQQETFTFTVTDKAGNTATETFQISLTGRNDGPVITNAVSDSQGATVEDGVTRVSGQLSASDLDTGDQLSWEVVGSGSNPGTGNYGNLAVLPSTGQWVYRLDQGAHTQALADGEQKQETFTLRVTDSYGASVDQTVVITVTGTNDAPVVSSSVTLAAGIEDTTVTLTQAQLLANASDVDKDETALLSVHNLRADHGAITDNNDGTYTFTPEPNYNGAVHFTYDVQDPQGATVATSASMSLAAEEDAAVISGQDTGAITEDHSVSLFNNLDVSGQLTISDVDVGEARFIEQMNVPGNAALGEFAITSTGQWMYAADNTQAAIQALGANETLTDSLEVTSADGTRHTITVTIEGTNDAPIVANAVTTQTTNEDASFIFALPADTFTDVDATDSLTLSAGSLPSWLSFDPKTGQFAGTPSNDDVGTTQVTITATDSQGATVSTTFSLVVNNTNDAPVLNPIASVNVNEDGQQATGQLSATDPDTGDTLTYSVASPVDGLTLNADGSYTFDPSNAAYQSLPDGQTQTLTIPVTVTDSAGATDTQNLTITITGTNDVPTIAGVSTQTVTEDTGRTTSGQLTISDADAGEDHFQAGDLNGTYGTLHLSANGAWTYDLDNSNAAIQALGDGDSTTDTITVQSADGTTRDITITINGTNDAATFTGDAGSVMEDGSISQDLTLGSFTAHQGLSARGQLTVHDVDGAAESQLDPAMGAKVESDGNYGHFLVLHSGTWVYSTDNSNPAIQALGDGESLTDSMEVTSADGTRHTIVVTINGTNDTPTVTGQSVSETEDQTHTFSESEFGFADADVNDVLHHVTITGLPDAAEGVLTLDGHAVSANQEIAAADIGKLVFTPTADFNGDVAFKYTVSDGKSNSAEATGTLSIASVNDTAVIGGTDTGSVTEDTALTASGQLTISDADAGEAVFQTQTGASTRYGHFSVDAAGQWIYSLESSNQAVQSLGVNEHLADRISVTSADGTVHVVSVTINGTNDVPTVSASPIGGTEDTDHTFSVSDFGFHDVDTNDTLDHVTFSALPAVTEGELLLNGHSVSKGDEISKAEIEAGNLVFKPAANYNGDVHFKYTVNDGHVDSSEATGVIQVNATSGAVQYDEPDMLNDGDTFDYEVDLVMQDGHDHTGGDHADHLHHVALDDVVLVIPDSQHQAVSPPPVTGAAAYLDALGIVPPPSANKATEHQLPADMDIVMAKAEQLDFDHDGNAHVDLSDALEHQGYEHKQQDHDDTKHHHQVDDLSDIDPNS